jgi:hypothetical protein
MKTIVVTTSISIKELDVSYFEKAIKLINSNLEYTNFDILVLTNNVAFFSKIKSDRVKIIDYSSNFNEPITSSKSFNMHIKRYSIKLGQELGYDIIFYNDCDCFIVGWDDISYKSLVYQDFDIFFPKNPLPELSDLYKNYKHFKEKIDNEFSGIFYDELFQSPNPPETRVIFKNNEKLKVFLKFWDKISDNNKNYFTYYDSVYFGTSAKHSKMKMSYVKPDDKFSKFCKISHNNKTLNYFGYPTNE